MRYEHLSRFRACFGFFRNDHWLLHIVAGVKRLLMKLKSREIYSGTWPQSAAALTSQLQ